jgi:hypothetical protein
VPSCSATRDPRRDNGSRSVRGRQSANPRIPGGLVSSTRGNASSPARSAARMRPRAANGQQLPLLGLLGRDPCMLPSHVRKRAVRRPAHSPDPSRPACRRLGFRAWNIAEHAWSPGPASRGALGGRCPWSGPPGGDLGVGSGHLARWHSSSARVRLVDGGLWWPEVARLRSSWSATSSAWTATTPVADVDAAWSAGVWWFTPIAQVDLVRSRLQTADAGAHHQVVTAPEGVAP